MNTATVRSKLAELADRFVTRTAGELVTLRECVDRASKGDSQAYLQLRDLAHRIHGTGATLGFTEVGEQAATIERLAEEQSRDFGAMNACIARIEDLIHAASTQRSAIP